MTAESWLFITGTLLSPLSLVSMKATSSPRYAPVSSSSSAAFEFSAGDDSVDQQRQESPSSSQFNMVPRLFLGFVTMVLIISALGTYIFFYTSHKNECSRLVKRIAFGSCSSYDMEPLPVFTRVVEQEPDVWIWAGDMVYLDEPDVDCASNDYAFSEQVNLTEYVTTEPESDTTSTRTCQCACDPSWLHIPPSTCAAGSTDHALSRWLRLFEIEEYKQFLNFMCPGALASGMIPPPGLDASICTRTILGIYDDHDFGWNNGNKRLPDKKIFKDMYLDAIGESVDSPRFFFIFHFQIEKFRLKER